MLRFIFLSLLAIHGLIHLLGWIKAFNLAELPLFTVAISKFAGVLWLFSTLLWMGTMLLFLIKRDEWWIAGLLSLIMSQGLILIYWQDAKLGTIANIMILAGLIWGYGHWTFNRMIKEEVTTLIQQASSPNTKMDHEEIVSFPVIVQKWLERSDSFKGGNDQILHLCQTGTLKTTPNGKWLPVEAEQWFTLHKPGFVWKASVGKGSMTPFSGRDKFIAGKGSMLIKLFSLITMVKAEDPNIDQGAALRYLAETVWFPSAILSLPITWETLTPLKAKATLHARNWNVNGVFSFNEKGQIIRFETLRYYQNSNKAEPWVVEMDPQSYEVLASQEVPTRAAVTWLLPEGDFTWYRLKIEKMETIPLPSFRQAVRRSSIL